MCAVALYSVEDCALGEGSGLLPDLPGRCDQGCSVELCALRAVDVRGGQKGKEWDVSRETIWGCHCPICEKNNR